MTASMEGPYGGVMRQEWRGKIITEELSWEEINNLKLLASLDARTDLFKNFPSIEE